MASDLSDSGAAVALPRTRRRRGATDGSLRVRSPRRIRFRPSAGLRAHSARRSGRRRHSRSRSPGEATSNPRDLDDDAECSERSCRRL